MPKWSIMTDVNKDKNISYVSNWDKLRCMFLETPGLISSESLRSSRTSSFATTALNFPVKWLQLNWLLESDSFLSKRIESPCACSGLASEKRRDHASLASFVLWSETKCQRYLREYLLPYVCSYGLKFAHHRVFKLTGEHQKTISPFHPLNAAQTIVVLCTMPKNWNTGRLIVNVFVIRLFLSTRSWTGLALKMRKKQETFSVSFLIYYLSEGIGSFRNSKSLHNFMSNIFCTLVPRSRK